MNLSGVLVVIALVLAALELLLGLGSYQARTAVRYHFGLLLCAAVILVTVALLHGPILT
jgi:hypothetical protein